MRDDVRHIQSKGVNPNHPEVISNCLGLSSLSAISERSPPKDMSSRVEPLGCAL